MSAARPSASSPAFSQLGAIYAAVDAELSAFGCPATTECCRFRLTGREPYLTRLEEEALRRFGPPRPAAGRKKLRTLGSAAADDGSCPFLDAGGRCTTYQWRPFGCRTFFCERREGPRQFPRREINRMALELAELSSQHYPQQRETRPLGRVFARAGS